ncbi:MAG: NADH-quinone oxidoreductase subunit A [Planctomycetota bacterium]
MKRDLRTPAVYYRDMLTLAATDLGSYLPLGIIVLMAITFSVANIVGTKLLGPNRDGDVKAMSYESGMNPVGTARKRFNVRFYLIAMVFLVFDVEIVFLYPWAVTFPNIDFQAEGAAEWLVRILFFLFTTVVAYLYGFRKGVFKFD